MLERANASRRHVIQLGVVAVALNGMSLWCLYDGIVAYPNQQVRWEKYQELEHVDQWDAVATERGWPAKPPKKGRSSNDIALQYAMSVAAAIPGLLFLFFFVRARGRWIEADETGLRSSWGQELIYEEMLFIDKRQWRSKGIAHIIYEQNGRKKKFVLDDFKFDDMPTAKILLEVESYLDDDQFVNGEPETYDDETGGEGGQAGTEESSQTKPAAKDDTG